MNIEKYFNKDKLIEASKLEVIKNTLEETLIFIKNNPPIQVFLPVDVISVFDMVYSERQHWEKSAFYVTDKKTLTFRAPIYGIPFEKAIKKVFKERLIKSRFYFSNYNLLKAEAIVSDLIVHVGLNRKENKIEV